MGLTSLRLPWAGSCEPSTTLSHPSGLVAHGCADGRFKFVVPRRVELLFRE